MSSLSMMTTETDLIDTSPTSPTSSTSPSSDSSDFSASSAATHYSNNNNNNNKMTSSSERLSYRKNTKPLMEKKRRARINHCLGQLKSLVLQAMKKDNSQYSKLEKADILELTVKHLKHVQRMQQASNATSNTNHHQLPEAINKYRAGFNECANEVVRYLGETQGLNNESRSRILSHLSTILSPVTSSSLSLQQQQMDISHAQMLQNPAQILQSSAQILPGHAPILPAPTATCIPHHHQQQLHSLQLHHNLSNQNTSNPLSLIHQQHQELSQNNSNNNNNNNNSNSSRNNSNSPFQNELRQQHQNQNQQQQHHQQTRAISSGFLGSIHQPETAPSSVSIPDLNNNNINNINNNANNNNILGAINRNLIHAPITTVPLAHDNDNDNNKFTPSTTTIPSSQCVNSSSQPAANLTNSNQSFNKPMNVSSASIPSSSFHLPNIATTPASMTTTASTPFQLVPSALPNGQIALVLAPTPSISQTLPAMSVYSNPLVSNHISALPINQSQALQMKQNQEQLLRRQSPHHEQTLILQNSRLISNNNNNDIPHLDNAQEKPIPLVVNKKTEHVNNLPSNVMAMETNNNNNNHELQPEHASAFRQPAPTLPSNPTVLPSTLSSNVVPSSLSSSSSMIPSSVIKKTHSVSSVTGPDSSNVNLNHQQYHQHHQQQHLQLQHDRVGSASPPRIKDLTLDGESEGSGSGSIPTISSRHSITKPTSDVVRCPEDVTSKRDLFAYKMARSQSRFREDAGCAGVREDKDRNCQKTAWRPW